MFAFITILICASSAPEYESEIDKGYQGGSGFCILDLDCEPEQPVKGDDITTTIDYYSTGPQAISKVHIDAYWGGMKVNSRDVDCSVNMDGGVTYT